MKNLTKPFIAGVILLMLVPLVTLLTGWRWQPSGDDDLLRGLRYLTDTAAYPLAIIVSLIFCILFVRLFRGSRKQALRAAALILVMVAAGQGIKVAMKNTIKEPRPYVVWLAQQNNVSENEFYDLSRKARVQLLNNTVKNHYQVPGWLLKHWKSETGYAFPSGHALFAGAWALILFVFFTAQGRRRLAGVILLWGILAEYSRLALGMHWPSDIIMSVMINVILAGLFFIWLSKQRENGVQLPPQA
ncbi:phosphatidylglycerophosphatase [Morganella morganii]|uniref:undecaprenyl-diphosphate phosphatase n=1 Tax=Morganella morganii TaxID=582 RepID=A0A0D8L6D3_MORMO|nr:phosphatidylglycerophosphatase [Morganella morganii]